MSERLTLAGLVLRMATRPRGKLLVLGVPMVLVSFLLSGATLLGHGIEEAAARGEARLGADIMIVPAETEIPPMPGLFGGIPVRSRLPAGIEGSIAALPGVMRVAPQYLLSSAPDSCCEAGDLLLVGYDPSRDFTVRPWQRPDALPVTTKDAILVGGRVLKAPGAAMRFYNHVFAVAGRLERSRLSSFDNAVFIPLEGVKAMELSSRSSGAPLGVPWGRPSILLAQLSPSSDPKETALALERRHPDVRVLTIPESSREVKARMGLVVRCRLPLALAGWLLTLSIGGALQFLSWRERRPCLGLLQVYGCGRRVILLLGGAEAFILSLAGMAIASLGAVFALRLITPYLAAAAGLPLIGGGISVALSDFCWLWPAFSAAMAGEAVLIVFLMTLCEPADLLRGA